MHYTYILKSLSNGKLYKGYSLNPQERVKNHNAGKTRSTKNGIPWKIAYTEEHDSLEDALARERFLKSAAGRRFIKKLGL